jgi:hypothetical protein
MPKSDEQSRKALCSISVSFEPDSNVTVERLVQDSKDDSIRIRTDPGMAINGSREQHANANLSIRASCEFDSNLTSRSISQS